MAVWSAVLFVVVREGFVGFRVGRFDLGNMVQAVWSTAEGRPLEVTHGATGEQMVRLGGHVDPFLVLLAPAWLVWPSPLVLGLAQIVAVSSGALPVFWLARRHLGVGAARGPPRARLPRVPVARGHGRRVDPPGHVRDPAPSLLHLVPRLGRLGPVRDLRRARDVDRRADGRCRSQAWASGSRLRAAGVLAGAVIALAGAAWTFVAVYVIVEAFSGEDSVFYGFYNEVGGSPDGVVRTLVTDPGVIASALFEAHDVFYLVWLGLPLLFLFVLSPGLALVAIPQLLANGLSDFRSMTDPRYHSVAAIVPFLIAATVFGIARIRPSRQTSAAAAVLVCSATIALFVGPWARAVGVTPLGGRENVSPARVDALSAAIALVPDDAAVTVSNIAGAHLSGRRYVYSVPMLERRVTWVVVDRSDPWVVSRDSPILTNHPEIVRAFVARLDEDPGWRRVFDRAGVVVYERQPAR